MINATLSLLLLQSETAKESIPWWQVATGILAIPAAVVGLIYTYRLSNKTRLESRKLELEIIEKEGGSPETDAGIIKQKDLAQSPRVIAARIQDFVVRFIILYLALLGWEIIRGLMLPFQNASIAWLINKFEVNPNNNWFTVFWVTVVTQAADFGKFLIFFLLGWPLLSDVTKAFGLRPLKLFRGKGKKGG